MNTNFGNISGLCRSCMKEVASWERENFDTKAVEMFSYCTNLVIENEEKLPKQFCYDCIIKIESSYTFIKRAQNVDATLKNIASRSETSVIVEREVSKTEYKDQNKLQLTLPDYKLSIGINEFKHDTCIQDYSTAHTQNIQQSNEPETVEKIECIINTSVILDTGKKKKDPILENETKKNVCPLCKKAFTSKIWYNKHMDKEHAGNKYLCTQCPKSFARPSQLAYHSASHSNERKFSCTTCGKSFKRKKQLTIHTRGHSEVRPFGCDKCPMRFKLKSILKGHMKVHETTKMYLCSFCGWSFSQASNLRVHMRTHTGAKPYACSECSFRAAAASSLRRHQRRHANARAHVCTHCRKGFFDASGLARHVRTHTGALPYKCPGCARAFVDSWKRKTHLMRAHRLALADIPRMRRDGTAIT
ncbi:zinc finger protein 771-like [Aricia agestis]|uniref:zinc finger protein 771-like n=1 Tax=Aricia agestis TaxID=91739 RepID=UPI001C20C003|nr:zinc finger protein 771-like [Aricia agestis]